MCLDIKKVNNLSDNMMLKVNPNLYYEWNFEKNVDIDIYKVTKGMHKKVWWKCLKCKSEYDCAIAHRCNNKGCGYCAGRKVNHTNSLFSIKPDVASEWNYNKNGDLTPHDVTHASSKKVWWKCDKNHEWEATVTNRSTRNTKCPYCQKKAFLTGFSDIKTLNKKMYESLVNKEDGVKYSPFSLKKTLFKCLDCGNIKEKAISNVNRNGFCCDLCGDGVSYPHKFMSNFLNQLGIKFETEYSFDWSNKKRYDFYIPSLNMIIEAHGRQHNDVSFGCENSRTIEEEQENDKYKKELALDNGISEYIEVDCSFSNMEYIKDSVLKTKMKDLFNLDIVDWITIGVKSEKSLAVESWNLYNKGVSMNDIAETLKIKKNTVRDYLKRGNKLNKVNYTTEGVRRKVVQLDKDNKVVMEHRSVADANRHIGSRGIIDGALKRKSGMCKGYRWMYKEDYEKFIAEQN